MSRAKEAGDIKLKGGKTLKEALASFLALPKPAPKKAARKRKKRP